MVSVAGTIARRHTLIDRSLPMHPLSYRVKSEHNHVERSLLECLIVISVAKQPLDVAGELYRQRLQAHAATAANLGRSAIDLNTESSNLELVVDNESASFALEVSSV